MALVVIFRYLNIRILKLNMMLSMKHIIEMMDGSVKKKKKSKPHTAIKVKDAIHSEIGINSSVVSFL